MVLNPGGNLALLWDTCGKENSEHSTATFEYEASNCLKLGDGQAQSFSGTHSMSSRENIQGQALCRRFRKEGIQDKLAVIAQRKTLTA